MARIFHRMLDFSCINFRLAFALIDSKLSPMSPHEQARAIFRAIRGNPKAIQVQKDAFTALAASITGENGGMQITCGTENGQTFTAKHNSSPQERLRVLEILMGMIERGSAGSKTTLRRFL